ncbi:hypothetical protein ABFA07_011247 [Porites harrisoni]
MAYRTVKSLGFLFLIYYIHSTISSQHMLEIEEKGTKFAEGIEIDEQRNVAVFRVPAHNGIIGADFYNDFKMRVTVTRILSRKVCYISEMDSTLSAPGKLKADLARATPTVSKPKKLPVVEKSYVVMITGKANRSLLTTEILDFCGFLPIYNTKRYPDTSTTNGAAVIKGKRRLFKRQVLRTETTPVYYFNRTCKSMKANNGQIDWSSLEDCKDENNLWDVACTFKDGLCFYFVTCNYLGSPRKQWSCSETHDHSAIPVCCDLVCGH